MINGLIVAIELSITLYFLHEGTIHSESRCSGWITTNYTLFQLSIFLMTWTSIERYLFVHHERLIVRHFILLHYVPIVLLCLYCPLLYIGIVIFYGCQPMYDVHLYLCGGPCFSFEHIIGLLDWVGNGACMNLTTLLVNVMLIVRHLIQRHRMKRMIITADKRNKWVLIVVVLSLTHLLILFAV
jgi:hypothetical protein